MARSIDFGIFVVLVLSGVDCDYIILRSDDPTCICEIPTFNHFEQSDRYTTYNDRGNSIGTISGNNFKPSGNGGDFMTTSKQSSYGSPYDMERVIQENINNFHRQFGTQVQGMMNNARNNYAYPMTNGPMQSIGGIGGNNGYQGVSHEYSYSSSNINGVETHNEGGSTTFTDNNGKMFSYSSGDMPGANWDF